MSHFTWNETLLIFPFSPQTITKPGRRLVLIQFTFSFFIGELLSHLSARDWKNRLKKKKKWNRLNCTSNKRRLAGWPQSDIGLEWRRRNNDFSSFFHFCPYFLLLLAGSFIRCIRIIIIMPRWTSIPIVRGDSFLDRDDFDRLPPRLYDQHFGMGMREEDIIPSTYSPYYSRGRRWDRNPEIRVLRKSRSTDFEALKLWKGRSARIWTGTFSWGYTGWRAWI